MPSTNMLTHSKTLCRCLAKLLLSFCGIASFGVLSMMGILALGVLSVLSIGVLSLSVLGSDAHAARVTSATTDVTVDLGASISVRVLDSTAAQEISLLAFDLTPTAAGVTSTQRAVVDVSTSNITGYKLYVEANGKDHNNNYTTDLVHSDTLDSHVIPTSTSTTSSNNFWNYVNPLISTTSVIPDHGTPDKINQETTPIDSSQTNIDINVGVDTTITAGTYSNQLLFTAIANEDSINYTLDFEPNPPSGVDPSAIENLPADQSASSVTTSHTFTLSSFTPTLAGYTFLGYVNPEVEPGEKGSAADPYMPGESVIVYADTSTSSSAISGSMTLNLTWEIVSSTLTVDPNGGTWSGSTSAQTFPGEYGDTKTIANPSANPTYTISYNANGQGASYTPSPTSASRSFTGWTLTATGGGTPSGSFDSSTGIYTYNVADDTLTAGYNTTSNTFTLPTLTKTGHTCEWHENSASGTGHKSGETDVTISANTEFYAVCTANSYTLTVNPNGGTWGGSTSSQSFTQDYGTTKTISNPTAGATYTISYNMTNTAGTTNSTTETTLSAPTSPTSVQRSFTSWSLSGSGSFAGNTYTYEAGDGTLTAQYNTTSNTFTLPTISKAGHTCTWHKGSATGTSYASGATNVTITGNTTFYGVCESQFWTISNMQDMTTAICNSVYTPSNATGSSATIVTTASGYKNVHASGTANVAQRSLYDIRDNNLYTVRKLADGNCWMTGNLKYSLAANTNYIGVNHSTNETFTFNTGAACATDGACIMNGNTVMTEQVANGGYYYSWYAATAGTGTSSMSSGDASGSICPKGWRLPANYTSNPDKSYGGITLVYLGFYVNTLADHHLILEDTPLQFVRSGNYFGGSFHNMNLGGYAASSTVSATDSNYLLAYSTTVNPSRTDPQFSYYKYTGFPVRCVAR